MSFTPPLRKSWDGHRMIVVHDDDEAEEAMVESCRVQRWYATFNAALAMPGVGRGKESLAEYLDTLHRAATHLADLAHGPLETP